MSIRNLLGTQKSWINIKADTIDPITVDVNSGDVIKFPVGSTLTLNGSTGTTNYSLQKIGSIIEWIDLDAFGSQYNNQVDSTPFNTTSTSYVIIPTSQLSTPVLPNGNYVLLYSLQGNIGAAPETVNIKFSDVDTAEDLNFWQDVISPDNVRFSGMKVKTVSGIKNWAFYIQSGTGTTVSSVNTVVILYRLS